MRAAEVAGSGSGGGSSASSTSPSNVNASGRGAAGGRCAARCASTTSLTCCSGDAVTNEVDAVATGTVTAAPTPADCMGLGVTRSRAGDVGDRPRDGSGLPAAAVAVRKVLVTGAGSGDGEGDVAAVPDAAFGVRDAKPARVGLRSPPPAVGVRKPR